MSPDFIKRQEEVLLQLLERLSGRKRAGAAPVNESNSDFGDLSSATTLVDSAMLAVSNSAQTRRDVEHALTKMQKGTYGVCEYSGEPIGLERLEAIPWARFSIEAQTQLEKQGRNNARSGVELFGAEKENQEEDEDDKE